MATSRIQPFIDEGACGLPRNAQVRIRLGQINLMALDVTGAVVARLEADAAAPVLQADEEGDDEAVAAGPLAIAVDVDEAPAHTAEQTPAAA